MTKTFKFKNVTKFLKSRQDAVAKSKSMAWDDAWATDKKWLGQLKGFFNCKFCAQPMYAAEYRNGEITVSCRTTLCPGNIDDETYLKLDPRKINIKEMTNQYLFDSMMRF